MEIRSRNLPNMQHGRQPLFIRYNFLFSKRDTCFAPGVSSPVVIHLCHACRCQHVHTSRPGSKQSLMTGNVITSAHRPILAILIRVLHSLSFCFVPGIFPFYFHRRLTLWYEFIILRYWSVDSYLPHVFAAALVVCTGSAVVVQLSTLGHQPPLREMTGRLFYQRRQNSKAIIFLANQHR